MFETITTARAGYSTKVGEQLPACWEVVIHFSKYKKLQRPESFLYFEMQRFLERSHKHSSNAKQHQPLTAGCSLVFAKPKSRVVN